MSALLQEVKEGTVIEECSPGLLESLRQIDREQFALQTKQNALIEGYTNGKGWDMAKHSLNIDIQSGVVVLTPIE